MYTILGVVILIAYFEFFVWRPYQKKKEYKDFYDREERKLWNYIKLMTPEQRERNGWMDPAAIDDAILKEYKRVYRWQEGG